MSQKELIMPKMGESIMEATILKWLKKEGDSVGVDEAVLEIATDKVDSEVPSPFAGTITKILFNEGDVVQIGKAIAIIDGAGGGAQVTAPVTETVVKQEVKVEAPKVIAQPVQTEAPVAAGDRFYSPLVLNIARQEGISMAELERIPGTGKENRVTKSDILNYVQNRGAVTTQTAAPVEVKTETTTTQVKETPVVAQTTVISGNNEIKEMDRMRKLIADHMVMSKQTSPHVTSYVEADVTNIVLWREKIKKQFEQKEKTKLTFTPIFIEALVKAIKDFPMINISVDGDKIIKRGDINMGMATALPSGNLIVPVIRNADMLNLAGIAKRVNDLAERARNNKLTPDEISGGTYTITNVGSFGNVMGTPIINQPQVAIMAVGAIRKKPAVIETPSGDFIGIRHMMFLSHSYDHRVVDGALGGQFVRRVADYLEAWDINREV